MFASLITLSADLEDDGEPGRRREARRQQQGPRPPVEDGPQVLVGRHLLRVGALQGRDVLKQQV